MHPLVAGNTKSFVKEPIECSTSSVSITFSFVSTDMVLILVFAQTV